MAAQTDSFLIHGDLVGEDGRFRQNAALVNGGGLQHLLHPGQQLFPIGRHGLGRALLHLTHHRFDGISTACDILAQLAALDGAHGVVGGQRLVQHSADIGSYGLQILLRLGDSQHIGELRQRNGVQAVLQREHVL